MAWDTKGLLASPASGAVLADTGRLPPGHYTVALLVWTETGTDLVLQLRNEANSVNRLSQVIGVRATHLWLPIEYQIPVQTNERLRLVMRAALVGEIQASLFWSP